MTVVLDRSTGPDHTRPDAWSTPHHVNLELIRKTALGDRQAFRELYEAYQARVRGFARTIVRNPGLADEVTQEVFLQIWRTATRFDPTKGSLTAWVMHVTHARSVDRIRTAESHRRLDHHFGVNHHNPDNADVHESLFAGIERDQVSQALALLSDVQREAIRACYLRGLTHLQVSQQCGIPLGTVKSRVRDALVQLRQQLISETS